MVPAQFAPSGPRLGSFATTVLADPSVDSSSNAGGNALLSDWTSSPWQSPPSLTRQRVGNDVDG